MSGGLTISCTSAEGAAAARAIAIGGGASVECTWSPVPPHEAAVSPVRRWVLFGGIAGMASGWLLTVGTALAWPIRVGGKPIVSAPAFFVIAFELTILFAALAGLAGFLRSTGLPRSVTGTGYRACFGVDGFGLRVRGDEGTLERVRGGLAASAIEWREVP